MADIQNEAMFRTAKKGGYEKEDVDQQLQAMKAAAAIEKENYINQLADKDKEIAELRTTVLNQREEIYNLKRDISEKYQSYIDNYDTIGQVILDSKVQAKKIVEEAYAEKARILDSANEEVQKAVLAAREETIAAALIEKARIEEEIRICREDHKAVFEEIEALTAHMEEAKKKFDGSIRFLHDIGQNYKKAQPAAPSDDCEEDLDEADDLDTEDTQEFDFHGLIVEE